MHIEIQNCFSFWGTSSPRPYRGFAPGPHWGTSVPETPCTGRPPHILYQVYAPGPDQNDNKLKRQQAKAATWTVCWRVFTTFVALHTWAWYRHRRLATALAHAYNVIEMCAPAAPPIRLPIPNPNPNPNPRTHPNPNPIFNRNPNRFFKENKNDTGI